MYTSSKFWTPETAHQPKVRLGLTALEAREVPTVGPFDPLGEEVMLNPQPLPPGEDVSDGTWGDDVMLNPQPLPPQETSLNRPAYLNAGIIIAGGAWSNFARSGIIIVGG